MIQEYIIQKKKGVEMQEKKERGNIAAPDEAEETFAESEEQLLARIYDVSYLLQKRGIAEINIVETDDSKQLVAIILKGITYDKKEGFVQIQ